MLPGSELGHLGLPLPPDTCLKLALKEDRPLQHLCSVKCCTINQERMWEGDKGRGFGGTPLAGWLRPHLPGALPLWEGGPCLPCGLPTC